MSKFKVSWSDQGSPKRHTRHFTTADEARGFIKGLRISKLYERIGLKIADADGNYVKTNVAEVFPDSEAEASD